MLESVKITNVETIEIVLDGIRKQYSLSQLQDLLKGKKLVDIEVVANLDNYKSGEDTYYIKTPLGNKLSGVKPLISAYLTINVKGKEKIKNLSLLLLSKQAFLGYLRPTFDNLEPDWAKSYILLADGPGVAGESIMLTIYFND